MTSPNTNNRLVAIAAEQRRQADKIEEINSIVTDIKGSLALVLQSIARIDGRMEIAAKVRKDLSALSSYELSDDRA